ncbi:hypothetical protein DMC25_16275 [Caulobacter sp. D4A]|uniref:hypothetical protein n=1 Tax=unclassified Caulobacter TaxID=2648921 RepID=UPI000D734847|nr:MULTISPECIES: hypothetical protein [unclassified Caulobacter]PXA85001.1 hypothetical protein DMC25_16275 [Caulobacter sp. D4A]PXA93480.1 hypothetical protein DMC18_08755 [Caulobacter sp. D5]
MGEINIPRDQQAALAALDVDAIRRMIDDALRREQPGDLYLRLSNCGPYVANRLQAFERDLARYSQAKSAKKREETYNDAHRAGYKLKDAIEAMRARLEREQKFAQLFLIDDLIMPPFRFSERMSVDVHYRWRRNVEDPWTHGTITFTHQVDPHLGYLRPYAAPAPKRKPSAAKQEQARQLALHQTWDQLMKGALYAVRDYFQGGGDGAEIPKTYKATVDAYSRDLNNFSTRFWRQPA